MGDVRVFIDFGSTFTKAVAFDTDAETLIARVQSPSTVDTDVTAGLMSALGELRRLAPIGENEIKNAVACSSAAGGLRLVVIGLVPDYTTKAGYLAALGAGAKVVGSFSYELTGAEARELDALAPDIVLLTGGTDGGNTRTIVHNAGMLAASSVRNVIVAGNKSARDEIEAAFEGSGKNVTYSPNVMPEFGELELDAVNEKIRELFISRITDAKGISKVSEIISGVVMPTPSAVLEAAKLIADGAGAEPGLGELMLVDVGGATTDVYSVAAGNPRDGVYLMGLREPYAKRTVEGDLGLFHNLDTLAALTDVDGAALTELRARFSVPEGGEMTRQQLALSRAAVKTAVTRHVGHIEYRRTTDGEVRIQRGKDLTAVKLVIGAGGPVAFSSDARFVLSGAADGEPDTLTPRDPGYVIDEKYILFAIGLLSRDEPEKALRIAKKYLRGV
jgi:uncharacterized protein (TIGR01319 family)